MAKVTTQYNLWSSKIDPDHVPVQLQFLDDSQLISQLLKQQEQSVQVSNSNSSASDINCSDLAQSDGETSTVKDKMFQILILLFLINQVHVLVFHKTRLMHRF